jgi:hypothetical protein
VIFAVTTYCVASQYMSTVHVEGNLRVSNEETLRVCRVVLWTLDNCHRNTYNAPYRFERNTPWRTDFLAVFSTDTLAKDSSKRQKCWKSLWNHKQRLMNYHSGDCW